jgi:5-methylcytosine-specific restriction endonuclease McrA
MGGNRQGVLSMNQKQFYKTKAWRLARQGYIDYRLAIDGGLCEVCHDEPGKIVHHKIWLDDENCNDPEISLNFNNFMYECQTCHNKERDPRKVTPGRCLYGENGEIIRNTNY